MDEKNGHGGNEKQLFHGTEASSIPQLNSNGFNRSYAGKNGKEACNQLPQVGCWLGDPALAMVHGAPHIVGGQTRASLTVNSNIFQFHPKGLTAPLRRKINDDDDEESTQNIQAEHSFSIS